MRRNKKKKIIIIGLIGILILMTAGYAAFQTNLDIKGTSKISSNWNVLITNVTESNKEGEAETVGTPSWTDLTAYMEANLYQKGDFIEYDVTVENRGTLDAKLDSITDNIKSSNEAVKITFGGYTKGEKLYKNTNKIIKVKIEYNPDFTGTPEEGSGEVSVDLNYTQAEGGTVTPTDKYLVTYDCTTNGGDNCSSYNEYLNEGNTVNLNYSSNKEGFIFIGWNTNKDAEEGLTELQMPAQDITLYAIYKDTIPPECTLEIKEITLDNIKIKASCTDASGINKYELSENDSSFENKGLETEYNIDNFYLSKIKIKVTDLTNNSKEYKFTEEQLNNGYAMIRGVINNKYNEISDKTKNYETNFLNKTYPIGSIYISEKSINPSELFGGIWEEYGKGKTLVGVDENDSDFAIINKVAGTKTNTLAITNIPSHCHSIPSLTGTAASAGDHTHTRGTMDIVGSFNGRAYAGIDHNTFFSVNGAFSRDIITWSGTHDLLSPSNVNPAFYNTLSFNAANNWSGSTSKDGVHTHTVETSESTSGSTGSTTSFTNLQPYITVYMWKRIS